MTTYVFLTRHAKAVEGYKNDFEKPLSDEGIDEQKKLAKCLKKENMKPDVIYASPFIRAKQSAEILALELSSLVKEEKALGKDFDEHQLLQLIPKPQEKTSIIFMVGHAPTMAFFINHLAKKEPIKNSLEKSTGALIAFQEKVAFKTGEFIRFFSPY